MTTAPLPKFKVLLIGDSCEDIYQYGTVSRISPEAPVPVFQHSYTESRAGMAANVLRNLQALGITVHSVFGNAESQKTRIIDTRSRQHLLRIDNDLQSSVVDLAGVDLELYQAVVVSDYNKGSVTSDLICDLRHRYSGPMFLDTKKTDLALFQQIWVKINESEYQNLVTEPSDLIVTLGQAGARYQQQVYAARPVEVVDITGAGDTFLAALVYGFCVKGCIESAIRFANLAASITVQKFGVYAPTISQIRAMDNQCVF